MIRPKYYILGNYYSLETRSLLVIGEILIARLGGGATVVRFDAETDGRVSVILGRNKKAKIPKNRVILATKLVPNSIDEFFELRSQIQSAATSIILSEIWSIVNKEARSFSLEEISALYWPDEPNAVSLAAMLIHLDKDKTLFVEENGKYVIKSCIEVARSRKKLELETKKTQETEELIAALSNKKLPDPLTQYQARLVRIIKDFVVNGDQSETKNHAREILLQICKDGKDLQHSAFCLLVSTQIFTEHEPIELIRAGAPLEFPDSAIKQAFSSSLKTNNAKTTRENLTDLDVITIDNKETVDRDDAVSLEFLDSGYLLGIHITDISGIIPTNSAIESEAMLRISSIYLPEITIPMLPESFTNMVGSLNPGQCREALSLLVNIDQKGLISDWKITKSLIRSNASFSYQEIDNGIGTIGPRQNMLKTLHHLTNLLRTERENRGAINIDQPELLLTVQENQTIDMKVRLRETPGYQIVSELMILYNSLIAQFCINNNLPAIFRSQPVPDLTNLPDISQFSNKIAGAKTIRYLTSRRFQSARLETEPNPHGALGISAYVQATSPLRRYTDLRIQRQVSNFLTSNISLYTQDEMKSIAQQAEFQLKEVTKIEESRKRYWLLNYLKNTVMEDSNENLFEAVVLENQEQRLALLELIAFPFRLKCKLPQTILRGEIVNLKLVGVNLWQRRGIFSHYP